MSLKILVIRFSSIGDVVLTSPVVRALHDQKNAEVHFLTKPAFASIVEANPLIHKVHLLQDDWKKMISQLRDESFDAIIDLHHNLRTLRVKKDLRVPSHSFRKLNFRKWILVRLKWDVMPDLHIVERYFETVRPLDVLPDREGLDFYIPEGSHVNIREEFGVEPGSYCCLAVGAAHATKCLTTEQIIAITNSVPTPVVLLGGPGDVEKANAIKEASVNASVFNACGKFSILQSGSVLQQAKHILNFDSGLMHITSALNKPQVVVWGNTVPAFGMYPYYAAQQTKAVNFEVKPLSCRPCSKIGFNSCPKGHFKCMRDQDLDSITSSLMNQ